LPYLSIGKKFGYFTPCTGKNIEACIVLKKENDFFDFRRSNLVEI
jgi:hypothetical protein